MAKIYYEKDINLNLLAGKTIAIIGYGSQGHAHALNLRDSGVEVIIGLYEGSKSKELAEKAGFQVLPTAQTLALADIIMLLVNDEKQAQLFQEDIAPYLKEGQSLAFAHGFNILYEEIKAPPGVNVFMVAPKGPGHTVREQYLAGQGVPCLFAVHQDASGQTRDLALAYAGAIGGGRMGILETSFKEETETDLFGEQTVLCGGLTALIKTAFEVLVGAGYQAELAYFECLHELKLIVDLINRGGLSYMRYSISDTAEYGDYQIGDRIINGETKERMVQVLQEIQDGTFARSWLRENREGRLKFNKRRQEERNHPVEIVGEKLRKMMDWQENNSEE